MLNLNAILVNVITGLIFGFNNMLGSKSVVPYMKGNWKFNTKKYPNRFLGYAVYFFIQAALFSIGFIVFLPIIAVLGKNNVSSFAYFNLAALVSSYINASWSLNVLDKMQVI